MANESILVSVPHNVSDGPIIYRDATASAGTKFLFDFLDTYCNANATGALPSGAIFTNLVDGAPNGVNGNTNQVNEVTGGITFNGTIFNGINLGTSYNLSGTNPSFVVIAWIKVGTGVGNDKGLLSLGTSTTVYQHKMTTSSGGTRITVGAANTGLAIVNTGAVMQVAVSWSPLGVVRAFANGVLVGQSNSAPTTLTSFAATNTTIGADPSLTAGVGTVYRVLQENLTVSGNTDLAVVMADYADNVGRFV